LRAEYSTYSAEKEFLTVNSLNKLRQDLTKKEGELAHDKKNYQKLQGDYNRVKNDLAGSREEEKVSKKVIGELRGKIAEEEKALIDQAKKQGEKGELLEALTRERDELRTKHETEIAEARTKQREVQSIQEELSERNNELSTQITNEQAKNNQLNNKVGELEGKLFVLGNAAQALLEQHLQQEQD